MFLLASRRKTEASREVSKQIVFSFPWAARPVLPDVIIGQICMQALTSQLSLRAERRRRGRPGFAKSNDARFRPCQLIRPMERSGNNKNK